MQKHSDLISASVRKILASFEKIRGKSKEEFGNVAFWDLVVLTAADEAQRLAYEQQIADKLAKRQIPSGIPYHVFADPPGPKIGSGGSNMYTIHELDKLYGPKLRNWRILLISAGGQSKRLPSASALGKIFTPLPMGNPVYQLFDLKLAIHLPFLKRMKPGYYMCASDDIVVYDLGDGNDFDFEHSGFTALAHISNLSIAVGHGVYVLKDDGKKNPEKATELRECLQVLQKPSVELIKETGALVNAEGEEPCVYSDSEYYFDHDVADKMLTFYHKEAPLDCEICAYGDFLQALGPRANIDYTRNIANVSKVESNLIETREKIFHLMKRTKLNILAMNISTFYHIGTTSECLYHLCEDEVLAHELGFQRHVFSHISSGVGEPGEAAANKLQGCMMQSFVAADSSAARVSVMEYCNFRTPVHVGSRSLLSNIEYDCRLKDTNCIEVPAQLFLHTIPVKHKGSTKFVTVAFGIDDNLKKEKPVEKCLDLTYMNLSMSQFGKIFNLDVPNDIFGQKVTTCSLWNARLFSLKDTMSESLMCALEMTRALYNEDSYDLLDSTRFSMADALANKDVARMLAYRNKLYEVISEGNLADKK